MRPALNGAGDEAIRILKRYRHAIGAAVTDIIIPAMIGVDLARRLVSLKPSSPEPGQANPSVLFPPRSGPPNQRPVRRDHIRCKAALNFLYFKSTGLFRETHVDTKRIWPMAGYQRSVRFSVAFTRWLYSGDHV